MDNFDRWLKDEYVPEEVRPMAAQLIKFGIERGWKTNELLVALVIATAGLGAEVSKTIKDLEFHIEGFSQAFKNAFRCKSEGI